MVGGRYAHNLIASNILIDLGQQLKGKPCRALNSDSKVQVRIGSQMYFYYPDVSVVCGDNIREGTFQDKPTVIVEVLSTSTRRIDEGEKLDAYLQLPSLEAYILIEQDFPAATVFHRSSDSFQRSTYEGLDATIPLLAINVELKLVDAYSEVRFSDPAENRESEDEDI